MILIYLLSRALSHCSFIVSAVENFGESPFGQDIQYTWIEMCKFRAKYNAHAFFPASTVHVISA